MKTSSILLVVLVSNHSCNIDNISKAEPIFIEAATVDGCLRDAEALDRKAFVRAFCVTHQNGKIFQELDPQN